MALTRLGRQLGDLPSTRRAWSPGQPSPSQPLTIPLDARPSRQFHLVLGLVADFSRTFRETSLYDQPFPRKNKLTSAPLFSSAVTAKNSLLKVLDKRRRSETERRP